MPGQVLRALFEPSQRQNAVLMSGDTLRSFWARIGDTPERISRLGLSDSVEVLRAERP